MIWLIGTGVYFLIGLGMMRWAFVETLDGAERYNGTDRNGVPKPTKEYTEALSMAWAAFFGWGVFIPLMLTYGLFMGVIFRETKQEKNKRLSKEIKQQEETLAELVQQAEDLRMGKTTVDDLIVPDLSEVIQA